MDVAVALGRLALEAPERHEVALGAPHERARIKVVPRDEMIAISRGE